MSSDVHMFNENWHKPIPAIEGNLLVKERVISGEPFLATKIGAVEKMVLLNHIAKNVNWDRSQSKYHHVVRHHASNNAGITPSDDNTLDFFIQEYTNSLGNVDFIGSMESVEELAIMDKYCPSNATFSELRYLEPFYFEEPWSHPLEGKNVLVIHPFEKSIKQQYANREKLFKNPHTLPEFNLLTIKAEQTNGGGMAGGSPHFCEALKIMINKMNNIEYDIALIACGAYGLMLGNHAKQCGKQAVHIGGGLQILFGIKGARWDEHPEISAMFNEYWCRPLEEEKTVNYQEIEDGTYW